MAGFDDGFSGMDRIWAPFPFQASLGDAQASRRITVSITRR